VDCAVEDVVERADDAVNALLDEGWDVWLLNWRASIDFDPTPWTLDEAAAYDHPAAARTVLHATGADTLKAVVHCQGSTSFTMAAVAGLLPEVDLVVSNAVSLHPVVPRWSNVKLQGVVPFVKRATPYISAAWGEKPDGRLSRALTLLVRATHHECDNTVCRMVSFMYGAGSPALWCHQNLDPQTHDWLQGEFAQAPLTFFSQMARCVRVGHLVPVSSIPTLPASFVATAPQTDARFVFLAGERNLCFLPESQQRSHDFFDRHRPGRDTLHRLRGYGHLDVFMGRDAAQDVFPLILDELAR